MHKTTDEGNSGANHAVLNEQNDRWGHVLIETWKLVQISLHADREIYLHRK